jgi:predicted negative regulator of RcsB-dependent stress response
MNDDGHQLANWRQYQGPAIAVLLVFCFVAAVGFGAWAERTKQTVECKR